VRNAARFTITAGIGVILIFLGKALIMALSGWIAYIILMNSSLKDQIYSPITPVVVCVGIAYILASVFLSVFSFSATAILHCFLVDEEIGGNRQPKSLQPFIDHNDAYNRARQGKPVGQETSINADKPPANENGTQKNANNIA